MPNRPTRPASTSSRPPGGAQERRGPPLAGHALQGPEGLVAEPRADDRSGDGRPGERLEVAAVAGRDRVGGTDGLEDREHQVVGGAEPGQWALDRDVDAVPSGHEHQVRADDVAVGVVVVLVAGVRTDVLDQACGSADAGPDVAPDQQQAVDGARQAVEQRGVLVPDRAVARAGAHGQDDVVAADAQVRLGDVRALPGVGAAEDDACGAVLGAERDGDCHGARLRRAADRPGTARRGRACSARGACRARLAAGAGLAGPCEELTPHHAVDLAPTNNLAPC